MEHTQSPATMKLDHLLHHADWLRGLARSLVRDGAEAEDVLQEALLVASDRLDAGEDASRSWLAGVVRNLARGRRRRAAERMGRDARSSSMARAEGLTASAQEDAELVERQRMLLNVVEELPPAQRRAILLRFYDGLAPREIAARTGTPVSTVKSQVQRGLAALRIRLDGEFGDRRTWATLLVPLVRTGGGAGAVKLGASGAGAVLIGLTGAVLSAVALVAAVVWFGARGGPDLVQDVETAAVKREPDEADFGLETTSLDSDQARRERAAATDSRTAKAPAAAAAVTRREVIDVRTLGAKADPANVGDVVARCFQEGSDRPAVDALVRLYGRDGVLIPTPRSRRTDKNGVVRWEGVEAGRYGIRGETFEVTAGGAAEVTLEIPWSGVIRGRVIDLAGQGVPGARVHERDGARATSDAEGRFELLGAERSSWVYATKSGYERSTWDMVSPGDRDSQNVVLRMERGGTSLAGELRDHQGRALAHVRLELRELERHANELGEDHGVVKRFATTDAEGRYRFTGLVPVPSRIDVRSEVLPKYEEEILIEDHAAMVRNLQLPQPAAIFGVVTDLEGRAVSGVSVAAYSPAPADSSGTSTDADGRYVIPFPPFETSRVRAGHSVGGEVYRMVRITPGKDLEVNLQLPHDVHDDSRVLRGSLSDADGEPLETWMIGAFSADRTASGLTATDENGAFSLKRNNPWMEHLTVQRLDGDMRVVEAFPKAALTPGRADLKLSARPAIVRGQVVDTSGVLPAEAEVALYLRNTAVERKRVAGTGGTFAWSELSGGYYELRYECPGRATVCVPVVVEPGEELVLDEIVSSPGGSVLLEPIGVLPESPWGEESWAGLTWTRGAGVSALWTLLRGGEFVVENVPEGSHELSILVWGHGLVRVPVTVTAHQVTRAEVPLREVHKQTVAVTSHGRWTEDLRGGIGLWLWLEDAHTGAFAGGYWAGVETSELELYGLAAGAYRLRAYGLQGRSGETTFTVGDGQREPVELDLHWPGM